MRMTRRSLLGAFAAGLPALAASTAPAATPSNPLGLVIHSFAVRGGLDRRRGGGGSGFFDPLRFLDHCRGLGACGVQVAIGARDDAFADDLKARAEAAGMYVEGIASLPRTEADVARFEAEIKTAKRAGAAVVRTVTLGGRRYETFDSEAAFRRFADAAFASLKLAAPVVAKHGVGLAVENHKDWRSDELTALLKRVGCDRLGVCLDTGNSVALLEDPMEAVEALAPLALTAHFKDMAVEESRDGFLLSEVPLGTGLLDIPRAARLLRAANPAIHLNLEMITRDPLKVPCLTDRYWATFPDLPGRHLARSLTNVRTHPPSRPLPRVSPLPPDGQLRAEDDNIRLCFEYARERLRA